jgi:hypothetical protein
VKSGRGSRPKKQKICEFRPVLRFGIGDALGTGMKPNFARSVLLRGSLLLTITAGLAACVLNFTELKQRITNLQFALTTETAARQKAEAKLGVSQNQLAKTTAVLHETRALLSAANEEKEQALNEASAQKKAAAKMRGELAETKKQLDDTQVYLDRYRAAGLEPEQIVVVRDQLKTLQKSLTTAQKQNDLLNQKLQMWARLESGITDFAPLPSGLKANVLVSDPKWHFVVLDAGQNQGVEPRGVLLLTRQGKLVAKARVSSVENDRCIANLMPGSELGEVLEGDVALPAPPHS